MDIRLVYEALQTFLHESVAVTAAFLIGLGFGLIPYLPKWVFKKIKSQWTGEDDPNPDQRIADLTSELEKKSEESLDIQEQNESLEGENAELHAELSQLNSQLEKLNELDGDVWQRIPLPEQVPSFRTRKANDPPIFAVVNLKGGVGKTTITANLARVAVHLGYSPLLVDLDYQNSLSGLTLDAQLREDMKSKGHVVSRLIDQSEPTGSNVLNLSQRMGNTNGFVLATDENLTSVEMKVMARWITDNTNDDVRYRLRRALHSEEVQDKYDMILIDCPPRLTTACINALACCDYVLIPALLDNVSTEAVPRLLKWLSKFKHKYGVCPNLEVLGVVGNRARTASGMSTKQKAIWARLEDPCRDAWGQPVYLFKTSIPENVNFADAANSNSFAADTNKIRPIFLDLFTEIQQRIPFHAGQGSPAVSQ